jgi:hypothetical protein
MSRDRSASFVVRAVQDGRGQVTGVIERVATGAKEAFTGMEAIGRVIVQMLQREGVQPQGARATPVGEDARQPPEAP